MTRNQSNSYKRIQPGDPEKLKDRNAVICGYAPSLTSPSAPNLLSELRQHPDDIIITVSGAYEFLKNKGIIADYHSESDYRDHKVNYLKQLDPRTTFLIESSVCDNYFKKVESELGADHIIQWDISYEPWYHHPEGTYTFDPLGNVGGHAVVLAYFMGYRNLHIFGLDGNFFPDGRRHAGQTHLPPFGSREGDFLVEAQGKKFRTSAPFCLYVKKFPSMMAAMHDAKVRVYGDTLLSNYVLDLKEALEKKIPIRGIGTEYVTDTAT